METLAAIGTLAALVLAILERRWQTAPGRDRATRENEYDRDVSHNAQAAATGDAATLTLDFEAERQAAIRRGDLDPRGDAAELHQLP
jgi:hypothetical protein